ncbi:hypothetical protein SYNPS1DRAFT_26420 [Syncephalis pseudoplumigaleata]|uniref:Thioredoxin domain-containing protein n=1 Tax=Syncephalis pseudoplumigaleata TaxID=1712513 RepID=A0A4P9Z678_9FUNG|nr:hypothetical protein SYNPS1DRAFT_26420 [Syncephalis pseudoplumigaleata]|eukprot:RKP27958.1 hypothetical protein SYNPS1DRAFT_26420 [Syncephalis pseudoplumigaleata]
MALLEDIHMRLLRPHYVVNALSGVCFCLYLYYWVDTSAYAIEDEVKLLLGILVLSLFKFRTAPTAEERVSAISMNIRLFGVYMAYARKAWISLAIFVVVWLGNNLTSIATPEELDALIESTRTTGNAGTPSGRRKGKAKEATTAAARADAQPDAAPVAVVVMYAAVWAPASRYFETTFAQLSLKYANARLRFAVVNVDISEEMTTKYGINVASTTLEMPTLVLYRDGQERRRLPSRSVGTAARLAWNRSFDSVVNAFELDDYIDKTDQPSDSRGQQLIG